MTIWGLESDSASLIAVDGGHVRVKNNVNMLLAMVSDYVD